MKLGIVTISSNQGRYLQAALDSVRVESPHSLSYVIVDPGSTDGSRDIILKNSSLFSRIIFEPDAGPADGLNKGFRACDAEVYGYINSDDFFPPGALDFVADFFCCNPNIDVLLGAARIVDGEGRGRIRKRLSMDISARSFLDGHFLAMQQATFFRRRSFETTTGFNVDNRTCWDTELLLDVLLAGARVRTVKKLLGCFRIHDLSISGSGCLERQYLSDHDRIKKKLIASGIRPDPIILGKLKRLLFRVSPKRRFWELMVR